MSEWISTKTHLPEVPQSYPNWERVLIYENYFIDIGIFDGNKWQLEGNSLEIYPTHWMPLPSAPKESEA